MGLPILVEAAGAGGKITGFLSVGTSRAPLLPEKVGIFLSGMNLIFNYN